MYNPLLSDPAKLKDSDLESKILELGKKYHIAARMGHGIICQQIVVALDIYKSEQYKRQIESTQKLAKKQDKDLDDLINVN
jgi:hypothetical protein